MKMSVAEFQGQLKEQEPQVQAIPTSAIDLAKGQFDDLADLLLQGISIFTSKQQLGLAQYTQSSAPAVTFSIELSPINLPMADFKKVNEFFSDEKKTVPLNLYFVTRSEYLNVSHFHIDLLGSSEDDPQTFREAVAKLLHTNWETIVDHYQNPPEPKKPATPKRKTASKSKRKTTTRKKKTTTRKKSTTQKKTSSKTATRKNKTTKNTKAKHKTTKK